MHGGAEVVKVAGKREREGAGSAAWDGFCLEDFHREASHGCMNGSGETVGSGADDRDLTHRNIMEQLKKEGITEVRRSGR